MGNCMSPQTPVVLCLEDIRLELDPDGDSSIVAVALDLLHTVISDNKLLHRFSARSKMVVTEPDLCCKDRLVSTLGSAEQPHRSAHQPPG
jgi:hypothetical protein